VKAVSIRECENTEIGFREIQKIKKNPVICSPMKKSKSAPIQNNPHFFHNLKKYSKTKLLYIFKILPK